MFYALPAETVFEAKERNRRATLYLVILLCVVYIFFVNLLTISGSLMLRDWTRNQGPIGMVPLILLSSLLGAALAVGHFLNARAKPLDDLLEPIGAKNADPQDQYHRQLINLVEEARLAIGLQAIQPVVLASPGCNAFSLQDGQGNAVIGVTEGLLTKFTRNELASVIAHEAAHLVHEDSRLVTTTCFLSSSFGVLYEELGKLNDGTSTTRYGGYSGRRNDFFAAALVFWMISGLGYLMTKLIFMAISRQREYLADADGVRLCKDPLALAESLYKISRRYRGDVPNVCEALFIMNPSGSGLDEQEGLFSDLFSNHPPVSERLDKLLAWAKSDLPHLQKMVEEETDNGKQAEAASPAASSAPLFMAFQENQWVGPYNAEQLLSAGMVTPATWVCPPGSQAVTKASEVPELLPLFQQQVQGAVSQNNCPRCKVHLLKTTREGGAVEQCSFCKGFLLRAGVLERLIARDDETPSSDDIKKLKVWRDSQRGPLKDRDHFPEIKCPLCQSPMGKGIHSMLTQVVIDHCTNDACRAVWCDGGELEAILMLIQDAQATAI
jgi:heat shock protein HtpX